MCEPHISYAIVLLFKMVTGASGCCRICLKNVESWSTYKVKEEASCERYDVQCKTMSPEPEMHLSKGKRKNE